MDLFDEIYKDAEKECKNQRIEKYNDFNFGDLLSKFLHIFAHRGFFKSYNLEKKDNFGTYDDFTFIHLYKCDNYHFILSIYVGSCYGCIENRYDFKDLPNSIKTHREALEFYKNDVLDVFYQIIQRGTIIDSANDITDVFQQTKKKIMDNEYGRDDSIF